MEVLCRIQNDGSLDFGERNFALFKRFCHDNPGLVLRITPVLPESDKQRRFFEGAVVPLVAYYQEGMDYRSVDDLRRVREWLKLEFNGELVLLGGKAHKIGKSTKGREALGQFLERVVAWLTENYAPPSEALDPHEFMVWRDTIFPTGGPETYIGYLGTIGVLAKAS